MYWVSVVLRNFLIYEEVLDWLKGIFETRWVVGEITISVEGIFIFVLIIFLSFYLIWRVANWLTGLFIQRTKLDATTASEFFMTPPLEIYIDMEEKSEFEEELEEDF